MSPGNQFKEIKIYNVQLPQKNLEEGFKKTGIKLDDKTFILDKYTEVDNNIDNSKYESLYNINKINTLYFGYKYALSTFPYPFDAHLENQINMMLIGNYQM